MKKFLLLFVSIALLTNCENSETLPVNEENNLVQKINHLLKHFKRKVKLILLMVIKNQ